MIFYEDLLKTLVRVLEVYLLAENCRYIDVIQEPGFSIDHVFFPLSFGFVLRFQVRVAEAVIKRAEDNPPGPNYPKTAHAAVRPFPDANQKFLSS